MDHDMVALKPRCVRYIKPQVGSALISSRRHGRP